MAKLPRCNPAISYNCGEICLTQAKTCRKTKYGEEELEDVRKLGELLRAKLGPKLSRKKKAVFAIYDQVVADYKAAKARAKSQKAVDNLANNAIKEIEQSQPDTVANKVGGANAVAAIAADSLDPQVLRQRGDKTPLIRALKPAMDLSAQKLRERDGAGIEFDPAKGNDVTRYLEGLGYLPDAYEQYSKLKTIQVGGDRYNVEVADNALYGFNFMVNGRPSSKMPVIKEVQDYLNQEFKELIAKAPDFRVFSMPIYSERDFSKTGDVAIAYARRGFNVVNIDYGAQALGFTRGGKMYPLTQDEFAAMQRAKMRPRVKSFA